MPTVSKRKSLFRLCFSFIPQFPQSFCGHIVITLYINDVFVCCIRWRRFFSWWQSEQGREKKQQNFLQSPGTPKELCTGYKVEAKRKTDNIQLDISNKFTITFATRLLLAIKNIKKLTSFMKHVHRNTERERRKEREREKHIQLSNVLLISGTWHDVRRLEIK